MKNVRVVGFKIHDQGELTSLSVDFPELCLSFYVKVLEAKHKL